MHHSRDEHARQAHRSAGATAQCLRPSPMFSRNLAYFCSTTPLRNAVGTPPRAGPMSLWRAYTSASISDPPRTPDRSSTISAAHPRDPGKADSSSPGAGPSSAPEPPEPSIHSAPSLGAAPPPPPPPTGSCPPSKYAAAPASLFGCGVGHSLSLRSWSGPGEGPLECDGDGDSENWIDCLRGGELLMVDSWCG